MTTDIGLAFVGAVMLAAGWFLYPHPFAWVFGVSGAVVLFAAIWPECLDR